jgi:hypothetical protein
VVLWTDANISEKNAVSIIRAEAAKLGSRELIYGFRKEG